MNRDAMLQKFSVARWVPLMIAATMALSACDQPGRGGQGVPEHPLAGASIGGPFELVNSAGETVRWEDFNGNYRIVYFGFTYCPDICPTDVQRMMQGYRIFSENAPELGAQIAPIFISVDPERDTPEVVGEFTAAFSDDLIGLTGTPEQVKQAADNFRVFYSRGEDTPGGGYLVDHSAIVYLFGPDGEPIATLPTDQGANAVAAEIAKWVN